MSDQVPTHQGPPPQHIVTDPGIGNDDRPPLAIEKLKALRATVQQRLAQLDADNYEVFLQRTPEVREEYATEALDEMFDWYEEYVAHRAALDHYLDALAVVEQWAGDPRHVPEPLPGLVVAESEEDEVAPPPTTRPFRPMRPVRPLDRQLAFGATIADTQQLRADLHREVTEVMPKVLASELEARLPILLNEQLRGLGTAGNYTPIGGRYTPDTPVQVTPVIEEQLVTVEATPAPASKAMPDLAAAPARDRHASHATTPRRNRR